MIDAEKATPNMPPVTRMVDLLGVSRSGYYAWVARQADAARGELDPQAARRADLLVKIKVAHDASDGVNGAPRITADLRATGEIVSVKTVAKIMRHSDLRGISPRPWRPVTTITDEGVAPSPHAIPDLVCRRFDRGALNQVWTSDITYLATGEGWLYLCAVRDGCSRRVIGYAFAESLHTDVVEQALRRAVMFREGDTREVIFHADRGCQYTSAQLAEAAEELDVRLSVGRTGVCWDNAQQESFWSTLKTEYYHRYSFTTRAEAITGVSTWIDTVYNRRRRHSALGQISPTAFEDQLTTAAAEAA
ncbi:transposase InsO family protein [Yimella lutea]|uniref:Transposase InsO family protein n=1 Tax=Yimella lutea TaxID=587872 RepID=A0A542EGT5_9MICO|nr:transposase InsO family protein [Yimella lutea]